MSTLLEEYLPLVIFIAVAAGLAGALIVAPFILAFKAPDSEKLSAYECGFNAFDDARMKFDVRFYLVSSRRLDGRRLLRQSRTWRLGRDPHLQRA